MNDIDDGATPDNEVPQELISRLREARELAKKHGGDITDGRWESEYTPRLTTWREHEEELKEMEQTRESRMLHLVSAMGASEAQSNNLIAYINERSARRLRPVRAKHCGFTQWAFRTSVGSQRPGCIMW